MPKSGLLHLVLCLALIACFSIKSAEAQQSIWVSAAIGSDANNCSISAPCRTFDTALQHTDSGGVISVRDPGEYGHIFIDKSVSIINDSGGTVTTCCDDVIVQGVRADIAIAASPTDHVTLRGLTVTMGFVNSFGDAGIEIFNAQQVDINDCMILSQGSAIVTAPAAVGVNGIVVQPGSSVSVNIQDTIINNSGSGIKLTSINGVHVTATVDRTRISNNAGAGIRADGSGGGMVTVAVSDSTINLNAGNGVLALSGPGSAAVHVTRSVIASNVSSGVQSNQTNGGIANVTVRGSTLTNNVNGAVNSFGGGALQTFGDNNIVGPNGTGFTGPIALQ